MLFFIILWLPAVVCVTVGNQWQKKKKTKGHGYALNIPIGCSFFLTDRNTSLDVTSDKMKSSV